MAELTVAFDADDTLWHNEHAFADVERRFRELMEPWAEPDAAMAALVAHERSRVLVYGYGAKSFGLSMIETACALSDERIPAADLRRIVAWADELLQMPTVLIDGALDAVAEVAEHHPVMIITKGDLHHQLRRIRTAGIAEYCFDVEVVADKDTATYERILNRHRIDRDRFVMVGNSVVSDVAPLLELGCRAVHIPYHVTWALETAEADPEPNELWFRLESIADLPPLIRKLA